jgi:hypothetical protein
METIWIKEKQLAKALARNEAFWKGQLEEYPLLWITAPNAKKGKPVPEPANEEEIWTDVEYVMESTEDQLGRTYYAGDALPVFNPWLGPDQFSAWLGADLKLKPKDFTSWIKPFVDNWDKFPQLEIKPDNKWWNIYLETVRSSVQAGKGKWVTGYPDLHTGIDALCAIRGPENLMMEMVTAPEKISRAMQQTTELWKYVVDTVSDIILPAGQGTSNWTMGWSEKRFLCIGQNDFTCMISPEMFDKFCLHDNLQCCNYVDHTLYHLDGPGALQHVERLLQIEHLDSIQWVTGAGNPPASKWLDLLTRIQKAGKSVQVLYIPTPNTEPVDIKKEITLLCESLDISRLFIWAIVDTVQQADCLVEHAQSVCREKRSSQISTMSRKNK